jgi:preprotein translocase subunit SecA
MEHMRESIGFHGYGQMDPLIEYKQEAYQSFQELMAEIQRDIVRFLFTIKFEALQPPQEPATSEAAAAESAPESPRADQPGAGRLAEPAAAPPPARPAAAAASGSLARATVRGGGPVPAPAPDPVAVGGPPARQPAPSRGMAIPGVAGMLPQTRVRNVVESSAAGTTRSEGTAAGSNGRGAPRKMGRNERCWCGSGKKYKFCHGA